MAEKGSDDNRTDESATIPLKRPAASDTGGECPTATSTVAEQPPGPEPPVTADSWEAPEADRVSAWQPGRYTLRGEYGRGGQARVMLALDEHIGREVAFKEILEPEAGASDSSPGTPSGGRATAVTRFLREARITGQLEHPGIVPVYELGRQADGRLYYTMRLVRGKTLSKALAGCKSLSARLLLLGHFQDLCHAVAYAHSRSIIHRDITPRNVMVGEFGETVLLDWGLAKRKGGPEPPMRQGRRRAPQVEGEEDSATLDGTTLGTPPYMSPEQASGLLDQVDERSDTWSLGAVLYRLLTGEPLFRGETADELIGKVIRGRMKRVREACPEAPAELAAVAEKALQRDPILRYQGAAELARDIRSFMTGDWVRAYRYRAWELVGRFVREHRAVFGAGAIVLGVILGSLVVMTRSYTSERQAREREEQALQNERQAHLVANYHLAQGYAEKASRLGLVQNKNGERLFAAGALRNNPAHQRSPFFSPAFAGQFPESLLLIAESAAHIYRTDHDPPSKLSRVVEAGEALYAITASPDGQWMATGTVGGIVVLWKLPGFEPSLRIQAHTDDVTCLAFSPDSRLLASASRDGTVKVWAVTDGRLRLELKDHGTTVQGVAFSPDGRLLASAGFDRTVRLWEVEGGRQRNTLPGHSDRVYQVAFSPDGRLLASSGRDHTVRLWEVKSGRPLDVLKGHDSGVYAVAFSPDGRTLASGGWDQTVRLWAVEGGKPLATLKGHEGGVWRLSFSPDGRTLASASFDKTVRLWDLEHQRLLETLEGHRDAVYGVVFFPDNRTVASASFDQTVRVWEHKTTAMLPILTGHTDTITKVAFSPDGRFLASASRDRTIRVWEMPAGRCLLTLTGHAEQVYGVAFSPDSKLLATSGYDRTIRLWEVPSGKLQKVLSGHTDWVGSLDFSRDGRRLASASTDKTVRVWDVASGRQLAVLEGHHQPVWGTAFSKDGLLASAGYDNTVQLWEEGRAQPRAVLRGHTDWVSSVEFSPDGRVLASSGKDKQAILWDVESGQVLRRLPGHQQWVNTVRFSPDGRWLATGSDDQTVMLWSAESGKPMLRLFASDFIQDVAFSPDSRTLAVGDGKEVHIYPIDFSALEADPQALLEQAEQAAGMKLVGFELLPANAAAAP